MFRTPSGDETFGFHKFNRAVSLQHSNQRRQDLPCQFCCGSREVSVCWRKREQVLAEATGCARPPSNPRATTHCCRQAGHVSGHPGKAPFLTLASVPTPLHFKAQHFQEHLLASAGRQGASLDTLAKTLFQTHTHHNDTHHILQGTVSNLCQTSEMISAAKTALYLETQSRLA